MKRMILFFVALGVLFANAACQTQTTTTQSTTAKATIDQGGLAVFPIQQNGFIGDPMPYFDGEKLNLFYLHDARDGQKGFHPWYLLQTTDFLHWEDQGEAIPYVNDYASQDLALGTGSVIRDKNGLYHAFYTGFNGTGNVDYKEKIQHATSVNLLDWTKHPEDGFYGGTNDFRDPYVLYMEVEDLYWMLITTRVNNRGVIKLYKSANLTTWTDHGVFFQNDAGTWNMECPTLIQYNGYWYLSYSEQGSNRIVHYRYKANLSDAWIRPAVDYFDGIGFYAGRLEVAFGRMFAFGWVGTKQHDFDGGDFNWAGNLVTHELIQADNGELRPTIVAEVDQALNHEVDYNILRSSATNTADAIRFDVRSGYDYTIFDALSTNATKITFEANITTASGRFGMTFFTEDESYGPVNVVFNVNDQTLEFYNVQPSRMAISLPQISLPYRMQAGDTLEVTVLIQGQCLTLYVDGQIALTTRMYFLSDYPFGFFGMRTDTEITNLHFYE
jgi:beta-fructofuranosidase